MTETPECAGCHEQTVPVRDPAARESRDTEHGRVDRDVDRCPGCGHVMVEHLSGPGARAWAAAQAIQIVT